MTCTWHARPVAAEESSLQSPVNLRFDPCKGFKFRVIWDGRLVAGVDRVSDEGRELRVLPGLMEASCTASRLGSIDDHSEQNDNPSEHQ